MENYGHILMVHDGALYSIADFLVVKDTHTHIVCLRIGGLDEFHEVDLEGYFGSPFLVGDAWLMMVDD
jgi:Fe2+ or Zn2+ uptake regulation protein